MTGSNSTTSQQWHSSVIAQAVYTETIKLQLKTRIPNIVLKKPHSNNADGIFPYLCKINSFPMWKVTHLEALQIQQFVCLEVKCNLGSPSTPSSLHSCKYFVRSLPSLQIQWVSLCFCGYFTNLTEQNVINEMQGPFYYLIIPFITADNIVVQ